MSKLTTVLNHSIGKKVIMSLTGLFLCSFIVVHISGNFQLFKHDSGYAFNNYTVFMTSNPLIKFISYGLYAMIVVHAVRGLLLVYENQKARPVPYAVSNGQANSHWTSRWMGTLGFILLIFICLHMANFWYVYKFGAMDYARYEINDLTGEIVKMRTDAIKVKQVELPLLKDGEVVGRVVIMKDLYNAVEFTFQNLLLVIFYVISMFALAFHLVHGFKSAFQSIGINHPKYNALIKYVGIIVFGILIPLGFAIMPVYFYINS